MAYAGLRGPAAARPAKAAVRLTNCRLFNLEVILSSFLN
jgi:hypothetical protein